MSFHCCSCINCIIFIPYICVPQLWFRWTLWVIPSLWVCRHLYTICLVYSIDMKFKTRCENSSNFYGENSSIEQVLWRIKPFFDAIIHNFREVYVPGENIVVDKVWCVQGSARNEIFIYIKINQLFWYSNIIYVLNDKINYYFYFISV